MLTTACPPICHPLIYLFVFAYSHTWLSAGMCLTLSFSVTAPCLLSPCPSHQLCYLTEGHFLLVSSSSFGLWGNRYVFVSLFLCVSTWYTNIFRWKGQAWQWHPRTNDLDVFHNLSICLVCVFCCCLFFFLFYIPPCRNVVFPSYNVFLWVFPDMKMQFASRCVLQRCHTQKKKKNGTYIQGAYL